MCYDVTQQVFKGNTNQNTIVAGWFPSRVLATFIRIRPTEWHNGICMRFELLGVGCPGMI